jgi:membrane fusion protein (multidrug efflux system)
LDPRDYRASLEEAQANSTKAKSDLERTQSLKNSSSVSQADLDAAIAAQGVADARLKQAQLNLEYATIKATVPGRITRRTVEVGNYVQPGQTLLSIVQPDRWVIANFKETQLVGMEPNQKVNIYVDALGITLHGHVESFQPGTGARFSLLPAENATGNYVKVVQRVPVKILIDEPPETLQKLAPGLSVQPEVEIP